MAENNELNLKQLLTDHFQLEEFTHSETARFYEIDNTPSEAVINNLKKLCETILEPARQLLRQSVCITSGYRCQKLNKMVGGKWNSAHLSGRAADIYLQSDEYAEKLWDVLLKTNFDQLLLERSKSGNRWIHVSISQRPRHQAIKNYKA